MPLKQMSFRLKPSYFERDGPVCTRSASTFSEFSCSASQLQGHLAQNKSLNAWKIANEVKKGWNSSMWLWMVHVGCKKIIELK